MNRTYLIIGGVVVGSLALGYLYITGRGGLVNDCQASLIAVGQDAIEACGTSSYGIIPAIQRGVGILTGSQPRNLG